MVQSLALEAGSASVALLIPSFVRRVRRVSGRGFLGLPQNGFSCSCDIGAQCRFIIKFGCLGRDVGAQHTLPVSKSFNAVSEGSSTSGNTSNWIKSPSEIAILYLQRKRSQPVISSVYCKRNDHHERTRKSATKHTYLVQGWSGASGTLSMLAMIHRLVMRAL